jgi:hypothetical protein
MGSRKKDCVTPCYLTYHLRETALFESDKGLKRKSSEPFARTQGTAVHMVAIERTESF